MKSISFASLCVLLTVFCQAQCPTKYAVSGSATVCRFAAATITLSGSQSGVTYQLKEKKFLPPINENVGLPQSGTGSSMTWQVTEPGTFIVVATNSSSGCEITMNGNAVISISQVYIYTLTSNKTCQSNATLTLDGSVVGTNYQLRRNDQDFGLSKEGTGNILTWTGVDESGTFSVIATETTHGCSTLMEGTPIIKPIPNLFNVSSSSTRGCDGEQKLIHVSDSENGFIYRVLKTGFAGIQSPEGAPVTGTGNPIDLSLLLSTAQPYTVRASDPSGSCSKIMNGEITFQVDPSPTVFSVSSSNTCSSPVAISLSGSQSSVSYTLVGPGSTSTIQGTGSSLIWSVGNASGEYSIRGSNPNGCPRDMSGTISLHRIIDNYLVYGSCDGGVSSVRLPSSQAGIKYQLRQTNPSVSDVGLAKLGTGSSLSWIVSPTELQSYIIIATDSVYNCTRQMSGSALVPSTVNTYSLNSSSKCAQDASLSLTGFDYGVGYQLKNNGVNVGAPITDGGAGISWTNLSEGIYTVDAVVSSTGCTKQMSGSKILGPTPQLHVVSGSAQICNGVTAQIILSPSSSGFKYQLKRTAIFAPENIGAPVSGTGGSLTWSVQPAVNSNYIVIGYDESSGCEKTMISSATVTIKSTPVVYTFSSDQPCSSNAQITLEDSESGVSYSLIGNSSVISTITGSGDPLVWLDLNVPGSYEIKAIQPSTGCEKIMAGSVNLNSLPNAYTITVGPSICEGETSIVSLSDSDTNTSYQLLRDDLPYGTPVTGTGNAFSFPITTQGGYSVIATDNSTHCINRMNGGGTIATYSVPVIYSLSLTGNCSWYAVNLSGSQTDLIYHLYHDNYHVSTKNGNGNPLSWTNEFQAGEYRVEAVNGVCMRPMNNSVAFYSNANPDPYSIGMVCENSVQKITLSGSAVGVSYQLRKHNIFNQPANVGAPQPGTGGVLKFIPQSTGKHSIAATNIYTNCSQVMNGTMTLSSLSCTGGSSRIRTSGESEQTTGQFEYETESSSIYPNPAVDEVFINLSKDQADEFRGLQVFNSMGTSLKSPYQVNNTILTIDIRDFNPGYYLVMVTTFSGTTFKTFIKR